MISTIFNINFFSTSMNLIYVKTFDIESIFALDIWWFYQYLKHDFDIQAVPFNINSMHFLLFKPELFLAVSLIFLAVISVFLRSFYRIQDITMYSYFMTLYILFITFMMVIQNLIYNKSYLIFNFALTIDFYSTIIKAIILLLAIVTLIITYKKIQMSFIDLVEYPWLIGLSIFFFDGTYLIL